jgi:thiol-disulfide isomerase/thioredoxin
MSVLVVAVVLVALLCLLDLLLTFGVIRRLKEHTSHLEKLLAGGGFENPLPTIGDTVGEFTATTVEGKSVSQDSFSMETLVAFFSPSCEPCKAKLPGFAEYAADWVNDQRQVITVVTGPVEQTAEMVDSLKPVSTVVTDGVDGPISQAFKARSTPTFCLVDNAGTVIAADYDFNRMPALAEA